MAARLALAVLAVTWMAAAAIFAAEAWVRYVAIIVLAVAALGWWLIYEFAIVRVKEDHEQLMALVAVSSLLTEKVQERALGGWSVTNEYGQAMTDLMGETLAALAEYDREQAEALASRMRDAWSIYSEHHPQA